MRLIGVGFQGLLPVEPIQGYLTHKVLGQPHGSRVLGQSRQERGCLPPRDASPETFNPGPRQPTPCILRRVPGRGCRSFTRTPPIESARNPFERAHSAPLSRERENLSREHTLQTQVQIKKFWMKSRADITRKEAIRPSEVLFLGSGCRGLGIGYFTRDLIERARRVPLERYAL